MRTVVSAPAISYQRPKDTGSVLGLSGSASVKDKTLTLTVTNPHVSEAQEVEIVVRGAAPGAVKGAQLAGAGHPGPQHVRAAERRGDQGRTVAGTVQNGVLVHRFPPASVTRLQFTLA